MSDPVGRRMWLNQILFPIELLAIVVTIAIWAFTKNGGSFGVTAFVVFLINLPSTKLRAEDFGMLNMVSAGDIKLFKKALKRSEEGAKLKVKLMKSSYQIKSDREFLQIEKLGFLWLLTPKMSTAVGFQAIVAE